MADAPHLPGPSRPDEIVPDERVHAAIRRAAQLQAEAAERIEQRARLSLGGEVEGAGAGGVTRAHLESAAAEAGISPEYIRQALVEQDALGEHAEELKPWVERASVSILRSRQRTIEMSRTIRAEPAQVLETMKRVFPAAPYLLTLVDLIGGEPLEGGVLVFNIPRTELTAPTSHPLSYNATVVDLLQLHVTLRAVTVGDAAGCEVTFRGDLRTGVRRNVQAGLGTISFTGALGGLVGGFAAAVSGVGIPLLVAAAGIALAGGAGSVGYGALYRHYLRKLIAELETLLKVVDTGTRLGGGFAIPSGPTPGSLSDPFGLLGSGL